jgi:Zn-dependent peptidase ImmA (M78 family)
MPAEDVRRELRAPDFRRLMMLKERWRVSIAFLIRQAFDHGLFSADQRQSLYIQLATQPGGRRREPGEFPAEEPMLVRNVIRHLKSEGLSLPEIANMATMTEDKLRQQYLGERLPLRAVQQGVGRTTLHLTRP